MKINNNKMEQFFEKEENKLLITICITTFIFSLIAIFIPNFYIGILIYNVIYFLLIKIYDLIMNYLLKKSKSNKEIQQMEKIYFRITRNDYKLIKGCLLTTKETFKCVPFKTNDIKQKIKDIDILLNELKNFEGT